MSSSSSSCQKNMNDERIKNQQFAAYEIIDTEKTYYNRLQCVSDVFILGIKEQNILDVSDIDLQFGCWNTLLQLSKGFCDKLQTMRNVNEPKLGQIIKDFIEDPTFAVYKDYLLKFEPALNRRAILSTTNKRYASFVANGRTDPRCKGFGLEPLLTEPVARVPRYKLLLEQLIKYTEKGSSEYELLNLNLKRISEIASANNEAIRMYKNQLKLMEVMMSIDIKSRVNLLDDSNRWFIRSGILQRQCRHGTKDFIFWLFNDQLLYGESLAVSGISSSSAVYSLNRTLPLTECFVAAEVVGLMDRRELAFSIKSPLKSFIIWCKTIEEKNIWITDLQKAISTVLDPKQPRLTWGLAPVLLPETAIATCPDCHVTFNFVINKRYHCRHCGQIKCIGCANQYFFLHHVDPSRPVRVCSPCFQDLSGGRRFTFDVLATAGFSVRTVLKVRGRVLDQINPLRHNVISSSCCSSISNNGTAVNAHITGNKKCPESPPPYQLSIGGVNFNDQIEGRTKRSVSFVSPSDETNTRGSIIGAETGQQSIISCNRQNCKLCYEAFSMFRVKTTCMNCGFNVCRDCSPNKFLIPSIDVKSEVRVCLVCYESLSNACFDYRPSEALTMSSLGTTTRSSLYLGAGINGRGSLCEGFVPGSATNKIGNNDDGGSMSKRRVGRVATSVTVVSVVRQSCKVCLQEFNFIKNIRCECDHCGVSACASCLASDVLLIPYISLDKACRVCRQCRTLLTGSFSPTLISIHMSALADASMNSRQADHRASVVSDEVRQSIYFLQSVTADELRELISPRSECSNLSSHHIDTMSHTSSTDEVNSAKYSDCRVTIPSYRGETVGKELGLELANTLKSSAGVKDKNKASSSTTFLRNIIASISSKSKSKSSRALFSSSSKVNSAVNHENSNSNNSCKMSQLEMVALLTSDKWADEIDICNSAGSDVDADIDNVGDDDHSENSYEEDERLLVQVQRSVLDNFTH